MLVPLIPKPRPDPGPVAGKQPKSPHLTGGEVGACSMCFHGRQRNFSACWVSRPKRAGLATGSCFDHFGYYGLL